MIMISNEEQEIRRRERVAYEYGAQEARIALFDDLRNLAGNFALEVHHLRCELRQALNLPRPDDDDDCGCDRTLQ